jgi:hypothetical protein
MTTPDVSLPSAGRPPGADPAISVARAPAAAARGPVVGPVASRPAAASRPGSAGSCPAFGSCPAVGWCPAFGSCPAVGWCPAFGSCPAVGWCPAFGSCPALGSWSAVGWCPAGASRPVAVPIVVRASGPGAPAEPAPALSGPAGAREEPSADPTDVVLCRFVLNQLSPLSASAYRLGSVSGPEIGSLAIGAGFASAGVLRPCVSLASGRGSAASAGPCGAGGVARPSRGWDARRAGGVARPSRGWGARGAGSVVWPSRGWGARGAAGVARPSRGWDVRGAGGVARPSRGWGARGAGTATDGSAAWVAG